MEKITVKARLYVPDDLAPNTLVMPNKDQMHYLMTVMRLGEGDAVALFNGRDGEWRANLEVTARRNCVLTVTTQMRDQIVSPDIWLMFAPVKKARLDFIAQKASEMGARRIWPVRTEFCQVGRVNDNRLVANAIEAAEQTERLDIAEIMDFTPLEHALRAVEDDRCLIWCDERVAGEKTFNAITALAAWPRPHKAALLIGPEGGFSQPEHDFLNARENCLKVSLGPRILRADTAAIAALTCFQSVWGDWAR